MTERPVFLYFPNDREDVGGKLVSLLHVDGISEDLCFRQSWIAEPLSSCLSGLQCSTRTLGYHLSLMLGDGCKNVNGQFIGVRIIDGDKLNSRLHQGCDEGKIAG